MLVTTSGLSAEVQFPFFFFYCKYWFIYLKEFSENKSSSILIHSPDGPQGPSGPQTKAKSLELILGLLLGGRGRFPRSIHKELDLEWSSLVANQYNLTGVALSAAP